MVTEKPHYTASVDKDLSQPIEDFRFEHRFQPGSEVTVKEKKNEKVKND